MVSIFECCDYFRYLNSTDIKITERKMHILLYLAQGFNILWENEKLFDENIVLSHDGPLCDKVHEYFKLNERLNEITLSTEIPIEERETLELVWNNYANYSLTYLKSRVKFHTKYYEFSNKKHISEKDIRECFIDRYYSSLERN